MPEDFNTIISKAREPEISHLRSMGLTLEDAEDIFQDASLELHRVMSSQRERIIERAYLHGICRNMAFKRLEALKREQSAVDDEKLERLLSLTEDDSTMPDIAVCDAESIDYGSVLSELLDGLPSRDYSVIYGFYIEGKSLSLLATENGMASTEVARTTKCRIMNRLREQAVDLLKKYY